MRALILLLGLLLAGCGAAQDPPTLATEVQFVRSGGLAGGNDVLTLAPDGSARLTMRRQPTVTFRVSRAERDAIAQALRDAGFSNMPEDASPGPPVPDDFGYGVVYRGHRVSAQGSRVPDRLAPVLDRLGDVARAHGMR
jgi:hypothetical protein